MSKVGHTAVSTLISRRPTSPQRERQMSRLHAALPLLGGAWLVAALSSSSHGGRGYAYDVTQHEYDQVPGLPEQDSLTLVAHVQTDANGDSRMDVVQGSVTVVGMTKGDYSVSHAGDVLVVFPSSRQYVQLGTDGGWSEVVEFQRAHESSLRQLTLQTFSADTVGTPLTVGGRAGRLYRIIERGTQSVHSRMISTQGTFEATNEYSMVPCATPEPPAFVAPGNVTAGGAPLISSDAIARMRRALQSLPGCEVGSVTRLALDITLQGGVQMSVLRGVSTDVSNVYPEDVDRSAFAVPDGYAMITLAERMRHLGYGG